MYMGIHLKILVRLFVAIELAMTMIKIITLLRRSTCIKYHNGSERVTRSTVFVDSFQPHYYHCNNFKHFRCSHYQSQYRNFGLPTYNTIGEDVNDGIESSSSLSSTYNDYDPYDDYDANAAALNIQYDMDSDLPIDESLSQLDIYDSPPQIMPSFEIEEEEYEDDIDHSKTSSEPVVLDENSPILRGLNANQIDAVTKPVYGITRVIAGPGSGKTRVLTNRIAYLLQQNAHDKILAVTFTRKASNEMQERVHKLIEDQEAFAPSKRRSYITEEFIGTEGSQTATKEAIRRVMLGTFHSVCTKILRWNGEYLSSLPSIQDDMAKSPTPNNIVLDGNFHISDPRENIRTLKETLEEYNINIHAEKNLKIDDIMKTINNCKAMLYAGENPFDVSKSIRVPRHMEITMKIYYRFREKFLATNSLDFDDLIYLARELLVQHPDVRTRLHKRWQHVFVDEYQDTSVVQVELIQLLTTNSLFVVGDADQSIYAWRGAYAESLNDFDEKFKTFSPEGVSTVYLMENYRSTSKIIQAAQKVIALSGTNKVRRDMIPRGSDGTSPRILSFPNGDCEADYLVKHIQKQLSSGTYSPKHTLAFIYRTNAQSRLIEEACVRSNLPYVIYGSFNSFYNRQEVKDSLCFLRWIHNGYDRVAMLRAIETPKRGLGDTAIREFDEYCDIAAKYWDENYPSETKPSALNVLFHLSGDYSWCTIPNVQFPPPQDTISSRPLKIFREFSKDMVQLSRLGVERTVSQSLLDVLDLFNLRPHFDKISKTKDEFEERLLNVDELMKAALRYENDGPCMVKKTTTTPAAEFDEEIQSPLGTFLDDISLVTDLANSSAEIGEERFVANLMTIHSSKGMEFDTVFFVGVEDGTIPSGQSVGKGEGSIPFEEEKRLCYVAMTRAKSELLMTWRQTVQVFSSEGCRNVERPRSRFLDVLVSKKTEASSTQSSVTPIKQRYSQKYTSLKEKASQIKTWSASSNVRQFGSLSETKFAGTASVYGSNSNKSNDIKVKTLSTSTVTPRRPFAPMQTQSSIPPAAPKVAPSIQSQNTVDRSIPINAPSPLHNGGVSSKKSNEVQRNPQCIDSSWFFPIGSKVRHKHLGDGVVLKPQTSTKNGSMSVLVEFKTGEKQEFPVQTTELSPIAIK